MAFHLPVRPRAILRGLFLLLFLGLVGYFFLFSEVRFVGVEEIKAEFRALGVWAPIAAVLFQALGILMLVPGFLLILATALIFGLDSIWISIVGQTLGSLAAYFVARYAGRDVLHAMLGQRVVAIEKILESNGFQYLFYLRLMAVIPLPLVAYGPGLVRVPVRQVLLATVLGSTPFILVMAVFGDSLAGIRSPSDLVSIEFLVPLVFLVAIIVFPLTISVIVRRYRRRRLPAEPPQ